MYWDMQSVAYNPYLTFILRGSAYLVGGGRVRRPSGMLYPSKIFAQHKNPLHLIYSWLIFGLRLLECLTACVKC